MRSRKTLVLAWVMAAVVLGSAPLCTAAEAPKSRLPFGSENTILTVRVKSINAGVKALMDLVSLFEPAMAMIIAQQVEMGLQELPGIDRNAPFALLILDPEKFPMADPVGVFTLEDPALFGAPEEVGASRLVVGHLGVIGDDEDTLKEVTAYLTAEGIEAVPVGDMLDLAVVSADVGSLVKRYRPQINDGLNEARQALAEMAPAAGGPAPPPGDVPPEPGIPESLRQALLKAVDYLVLLLDEVEVQAGLFEVGAAIDQEKLAFRLTGEAIPGSDFADFLKQNTLPLNKELAKFLPKEAVTSSIASNDPASLGRLAAGVVRIFGDIFGADDVELEKWRRLVLASTANFTGLGASAALPGETGMTNVSVQAVRDRKLAQENTRAAVELMKQGMVGDFLRDYGMTVTLTEAHREHEGIPVDRMELHIDFDVLFDQLSMPPEMAQAMREGITQMMRQTYGSEDTIVAEIVYGKSLVVSTYGPDMASATDRMIELVKTRSGGIIELPAYQAALNEHPANSSMFVHVSLYGFLETIGKQMAGAMGPMGPMGGMMPPDLFPTRAELPEHERFISGSGRVESNRFLVQVHVPLEPVRVVFETIKRKMMEGMQPPGMGPGMGPMPGPMPPPEALPDEEF